MGAGFRHVGRVLVQAVDDGAAVHTECDGALPVFRDQHLMVVGGGDSFPEITGRPRWTDPSTLIIPVRLQPNHEYSLSLNNERFRKLYVYLQLFIIY